MQEMLAEMKKLNKNIEGMREDLAMTLAIKRKHLTGKSQNYLEFESWGKELQRFNTSKIVGKFRVSKVTALSWMNQFIFDNDGYLLTHGYGNEPQSVFKKIKK